MSAEPGAPSSDAALAILRERVEKASRADGGTASPSTDDDVASVDRADLLTALMHEYGHILGFDDVTSSDESLMNESLSPGVRRVPTLAALNTYFEQLG